MIRASGTIRIQVKPPVHVVYKRILITIAAALLIAGCAAMDQKKQANQLDQSLRAYAGAVRWANFETAAAFAVPRRGRNEVSPAALDGIKVTGYVVRIDSLNEEATEATVHLGFTYYDENRGTIGSISQDATWYLDEDRQGWLMDDSLPRFKR